MNLQQDNNEIKKNNKMRYCIYFENKKRKEKPEQEGKKLLTEQYELLYIDWVQNTKEKQSNKDKKNVHFIASHSLENTLSALVSV